MRALSRFLRPLAAPLVLGVALLAGGCSSYLPDVHSLGIYKLDINQGNFLTQDQVERLKVGQTRQQVRTILGTPLVTDPFHENRWDYVYEFKRQGVTKEQRAFHVYFEDDKLARWEGDEMPASAVELNRSAAEKSLNVEAEEESGFTSWLRRVFGRK